VPDSFRGRTGRLGKPEIHINPMEKDGAAKAPRGSILQRVSGLDKRAAGSQGKLGGVV